MATAIIGHTGFVGGNICKEREFTHYFNTKNINTIKGMEFDELVITGVPAVKWLANKEPENDIKNINALIGNLKHVQAKCVILISTVDVYPSPVGVNEESDINIDACQPYGKHRLMFESFIKNHFGRVHILRLPGLFGYGLKKNIIFDFLNKNMIESIETRNKFQFYPLSNINNDIDIVKNNNILLLNVAVESLSVAEVAECCGYDNFINELDRPLVEYDVNTIYGKYWGMEGKYMYSKQHCLNELKKFILEYTYE
ncbi:pyridine nucleotide transhydrogenase [Photobacterium nomapromontoriensis]|uniref:pyridine nucleotide transhydrogenase n=1 Tax=Photobacterium nomapromontoriensis TaxID=2910237 RepID=UPI003D0A8183